MKIGEFLQSDEWARFQKAAGRDVFNIEAGGLFANAIKIKLIGNKNFLFVPRGPVLRAEGPIDDDINEKNFKIWLNKAEELGKKEGCVFIHIEPAWRAEDKKDEILQKIGCRKSPKKINPQSTYILNVRPSKEELLRNFARGMRYNIKYSEREGLKAVIKDNQDAIKEFLRIYRSIRADLKFTPFPENYYQVMGEKLLGNIGKIIALEHNGKTVSSTFFIFYGGRAVALHTFALPCCKKLKCLSYALWNGILLAKELGCGEFDFWGTEDHNEGLKGSGQLKKYFGAQKIKYGEPVDYILDKKYYYLWKIYRIIKLV